MLLLHLLAANLVDKLPLESRDSSSHNQRRVTAAAALMISNVCLLGAEHSIRVTPAV